MSFKKKNSRSKASNLEVDPAKEKCHCGSGKRYENCHGVVKENIQTVSSAKDSKEDKLESKVRPIPRGEEEDSNQGIGNVYTDAITGLAILVFLGFLLIQKGTADYDSFFSGIAAPIQVIVVGVFSLFGGGDHQTVALAGVLDNTWHSGAFIYKAGFVFGVFLIGSSIKYVASLFAVIKTLLN